MVLTKTIIIESTDKVPEIIDITDKVLEITKQAGINAGSVLVFTRHTTAAIILQEKEEGLLEDIKEHLCKLCPPEAENYRHTNSRDHKKSGELPNGHAHLQHLLLGGSSETIPIFQGKLFLGTYQKIFLVELDRKRNREIVVQIIGE